MYNELQAYCRQIVPLSEQELDVLPHYFEIVKLKRKQFLLQDNTVCNFIAFIAKGSVRLFHIKDGEERTCDIVFENAWVTDFQSFTKRTPAVMNLQAIEDTVVYQIQRDSLYQLYREYSNFETLGRIITENIVHRSTDIVMSLSSNKPEERFFKLIIERPDLFQRVPQKYIANLLGISPESLSRIKNRTTRKS